MMALRRMLALVLLTMACGCAADNDAQLQRDIQYMNAVAEWAEKSGASYHLNINFGGTGAFYASQEFGLRTGITGSMHIQGNTQTAASEEQ